MLRRLKPGAYRFAAIVKVGLHKQEERDELEKRLRDKDALLSEVQHRVKNNLQMITALMRIEARNADGLIDVRTSSARTYDDKGNLIAETDDTDYGADGVIDSRFVYSASYDKKGNLVESVSDSDWNADGLIDRAGADGWRHPI